MKCQEVRAFNLNRPPPPSFLLGVEEGEEGYHKVWHGMMHMYCSDLHATSFPHTFCFFLGGGGVLFLGGGGLFGFFFFFLATSVSFSSSFNSRWHRSVRKGPYSLRPVSQQSPQGCPRNSANICLVEHRSFSTLVGGLSAASFLHSSPFCQSPPSRRSPNITAS